MRAAIYTRISVDREEETSTTTQLERCQEYAQRHGWEVVGHYEDRGKSAYSGSRRPNLQRLLDDVDAGMIDAVVVWKLDRWCRSLREFVTLRDRLGAADCQWASVTDSFDTSTPMGRAMLGVVAVFAELESAIKSQRQNEWHRKRVAEGLPPGSAAPFGYDDAHKPIADEAALIREAARGLIEGGRSIHATVREWNEAGIKTRAGNNWSRRGFTSLLKRPTLAGLRMLDGVPVEGSWEPILQRDVWDRLNNLLNDPKRRNNVGATRKLLSGIAHCAECGHPMGHRGHVAGPRYTCRGTGEDMDACGKISIQADIADDYVRDAVVSAVADGLPEVQTHDPELVGRLEAELSALASDYGSGTISRDEWLAARTGLEKRLAEALDAAARARSAVPVNLAESWESMSVDARRNVVLAVIERIDVGRGRGADRISITWRA